MRNLHQTKTHSDPTEVDWVENVADSVHVELKPDPFFFSSNNLLLFFSFVHFVLTVFFDRIKLTWALQVDSVLRRGEDLFCCLWQSVYICVDSHSCFSFLLFYFLDEVGFLSCFVLILFTVQIFILLYLNEALEHSC